VGLDLGPSTIAIVSQQGAARLETFCAALTPHTQTKRRLQRKLDRQRRATNPDNYDDQGRCKKGRKTWHDSQGYQMTHRRLAHQERTLAAQRQSLHRQLAHHIVAVGTTIITEKISYRAWQKQYGRSVGLRAPGMFIEILRRTGASHGRHRRARVPTQRTKLSQYGHGCGAYIRKPLNVRWHESPCGIGPVQRDLYSAFLAAHLDLQTLIPSLAQRTWESAETRLRAAIEVLIQRANAGQVLPQSMGIPRTGARLTDQSRRPEARSLGSFVETGKRCKVSKNVPGFSQESLSTRT
jgi:hypothetical protein